MIVLGVESDEQRCDKQLCMLYAVCVMRSLDKVFSVLGTRIVRVVRAGQQQD